MPHIRLPEGMPGITSGFAFRPETAKPMRELAEVLLRGRSSVTSGERVNVAQSCVRRLGIHFPALIDGIDNSGVRMSSGWPDRLMLIDHEG